ncbi:AAA family ATPase [Pannus brasiliensis CCIBt3594]|uniref:AAA family ATPase n=1 Tax=Pannus brasiliensis CCIBt3594 TaxID=1427578 RepID=A0AAW9QXL9_9CHRO
MELLIENLGPIKNNTQTIDLTKKFYVFVGYNNSGKTYVSQLLWTIFNQDNIRKFSRKANIKNLKIDSSIELTQELINEILDEFANFIKEETVNTYNLNKTLQEKISIQATFKANVEELRSKTFKTVFSIVTEQDNHLEVLNINKPRKTLTIQVKEQSYSDSDNLSDRTLKILKREKRSKKVGIITSIIKLLLLHSQDAFFLPANRSFFPTFYQYIYEIERNKRIEADKRIREFLENMDDDGIGKDLENLSNKLKRFQEQLPRSSYTEPMNKVFEELFSLNTERKINSNYNLIINKISQLMGGEITIESVESIAPIQFSFKFDQLNSLPMYLSSSSVNQLTLLYLYLKYWAQEKDNFLMIDEPEVNLHSENQIRLMEILIQFVTEHDNRVLITTHSPILTDILNDYVCLHTLKENGKDVKSIIEEHQLKNLNPEISIAQEDLGVYFFTGDKIIDYRTSQYGAYVRNFREVINSLQKSGEVLTDYIYSLENEE